MKITEWVILLFSVSCLSENIICSSPMHIQNKKGKIFFRNGCNIQTINNSSMEFIGNGVIKKVIHSKIVSQNYFISIFESEFSSIEIINGLLLIGSNENKSNNISFAEITLVNSSLLFSNTTTDSIININTLNIYSNVSLKEIIIGDSYDLEIHKLCIVGTPVIAFKSYSVFLKWYNTTSICGSYRSLQNKNQIIYFQEGSYFETQSQIQCISRCSRNKIWFGKLIETERNLCNLNNQVSKVELNCNIIYNTSILQDIIFNSSLIIRKGLLHHVHGIHIHQLLLQSPDISYIEFTNDTINSVIIDNPKIHISLHSTKITTFQSFNSYINFFDSSSLIQRLELYNSTLINKNVTSFINEVIFFFGNSSFNIDGFIVDIMRIESLYNTSFFNVSNIYTKSLTINSLSIDYLVNITSNLVTLIYSKIKTKIKNIHAQTIEIIHSSIHTSEKLKYNKMFVVSLIRNVFTNNFLESNFMFLNSNSLLIDYINFHYEDSFHSILNRPNNLYYTNFDSINTNTVSENLLLFYQNQSQLFASYSKKYIFQPKIMPNSKTTELCLNHSDITINNNTIVINLSNSTLTLTENTTIKINKGVSKIFIHTRNQITLTFQRVLCSSSVYIHPLDYSKPTIIVIDAEESCSDKIFISSSIPLILSPISTPKIKINCGLLAISSASLRDLISEDPYDYDLFYSFSELKENRCPPFICISSNGISISSDGINIKCSNANKFTSDGSSVYIDRIDSSLYGVFNDVIVSNNVQTISWVGLSIDSNSYDISYITNLRVAPKTYFSIRKLNLHITKMYGTEVSLSLIESTIECTTQASFLLLKLEDFSKFKSKGLDIQKLVSSFGTFITSERLTVNIIEYSLDWDKRNNNPMIKISSLILKNESLINWIVLDSIVTTKETIPLLVVTNGIQYQQPTFSFIHCDQKVLFTSGTNQLNGIKCTFFGIHKTCVLIKENADLLSSYDMLQSSALTCPCTSDSLEGCTIVIKTSSVHGNVNTNNLETNIITSLNLKSLWIDDTLFAFQNITINSDSIYIKSIQIPESRCVSIFSNCKIGSILGNGEFVSSRKVDVDTVYQTRMIVNNININKLFSPSFVLLNNTKIELLNGSSFSMKRGVLEYIHQLESPINYHSRESFTMYLTKPINFPTNTCFELAEFKTIPQTIMISSFFPNTFNLEIACKNKVIVCNNPTALFECGIQKCIVTHPDEPLDSSKAYDTLNCPCGFKEVQTKYSHESCFLVAKGIQVLENMNGNFHSIEVSDGTIFMLNDQLSILEYHPVSNQIFNSINNYAKLDIHIIGNQMFSINLNVEATVFLNAKQSMFSITKNIIFDTILTDSIYITSSAMLTLPSNVPSNFMINITNQHINIPNGIECLSMIIYSNFFESPLFIIGNEKPFKMDSFEFNGIAKGVIVENSQKNLVKVGTLKNIYIDEEQRYLTTEEIPKTRVVCRYDNGWKSKNCPCKGTYCDIVIYSSIINEPLINISRLIIETNCIFQEMVVAHYVELNFNATFIDCIITNLNVFNNDLIILRLNSFVIEKITRKETIPLIINSTKEGDIVFLEAPLVYLVTCEPIKFQHITSSNLIMYQQTNKMIIKGKNNSTIESDNIVIFISSILHNFILQSSVIPPLDVISFYNRESNTIKKLTFGYVSVLCFDYLYISNSTKIPMCPTDQLINEDELTNQKQLWYLLLIPILFILVLFMITTLMCVYKIYQRRAQRHLRLF
ncbi:hypothetical protein EDI_092300 [Entamoeba dispar SAW760]|uniref:Uncharacterized protein n=1 Tax=Entamoeba dispar (strain ATCC PRA-260 / SAW760) TaxID=370354 RepID=B0ED22_ENTDS|nr:uncharacterized protein EDI_092300 [Entamoeba dispar SAW760]EDR27439.1 hypothetical protein EDI_092300 [Entamoeba dispar SAW760]|eukprot:EDR27439.1 hypothetical protein EDI_092300 [Entamoeba dispar SAW760]